MVAGFGIGAALGALVWMLATGGGEPRRVQSPSTRSAGTAVGSRGGAAQPRSVADLQAHLRDDPDDWQSWAALGLGYVEEAG